VRSFWGWGLAAKLPDGDTRRALGASVAALLGTRAPSPRDPPRIEDLLLPSPRCRLPAALGPIGSTEPLDRALHTYGRAFPDIVRGFEGDFSSAPDVVAHPRTEADIVAILDWASGAQVAIVPFGGGTSVVGGVECRGDGAQGVVSLDLTRLDRVLEVDPVSRAARIQAGATGPQLEAGLAPHGLTLRHFPQSFEFSTLGGWIATRAGGHFATLYTHIDDLVESVRMITPRGPWESRRLPGSGAGPSPDRVVLGSEGTLGVITEAWMRVQGKPRWRSSATVRYGAFASAVAAVREIAQSGLYPTNCRLLDSREALLHGVTSDGSSVLLLGFESAHHPVERWLELAIEIARGHGGLLAEAPVHRDAASEARGGATGRWRQAFFEAPYRQTSLVTLGFVVDTFETACTWDRFDALHDDVVRSVKAAIRQVTGSPGLVSCRFTHVYPDGPAPYYTFVAPGRHGDLLAPWRDIKAAASEALMRSGATITHHHAVGRTHRPWYDRQRPEPFAAGLRAMKAALDPAAVLNPGVLFDP
jgi:alkyldihydroxyacetonephosphate synthase